MRAIIFMIIFLSTVFSQTGYEIAVMINKKPIPQDISNRIKMILTNSKGKTRTNEMISKAAFF